MVKGKVINTSNAPVQGVSIAVTVSSDSIIQSTDFSGNFRICLLALLDLQFSKTSYVTTVTAATETEMTVKLERKGESTKICIRSQQDHIQW